MPLSRAFLGGERLERSAGTIRMVAGLQESGFVGFSRRPASERFEIRASFICARASTISASLCWFNTELRALATT